MTVYRISKWNKVFERAESRKLKSLTWVALPVGFCSSGYQSLLDEFGEDAPAAYGAWCTLVQIAAGCNVRGVLADSRGSALRVSWYARMTGFPAAVFERLIGWASSSEVLWLDSVPTEELELLFRQQKDCEVDESDEFPDVVPSDRGNCPDTSSNPIQPDITKSSPNPIQSVRVVRSEEEDDWVDRWRMRDDEFFILVCEIANRFTRIEKSLLSRELIWQSSWIGAQFDRSVVDACVDKIKARDVRNPSRYLEAAMRKLCELNGEVWENLRRLVPPPPPPSKAVAQ